MKAAKRLAVARAVAASKYAAGWRSGLGARRQQDKTKKLCLPRRLQLSQEVLDLLCGKTGEHLLEVGQGAP
jgi:hypothetical protein